MDESRLSVIIPARNVEKFIADAIGSIARDVTVPTEIIVVDDGSTDGTAEAVGNLSFSGLSVRTIKGLQKGIASARNQGLANISPTSEYVLYLDADDVNPKGKIPRQLALLEKQPELFAVMGQVLYFDNLDSEHLQPLPDARTTLIRGIQLGAGVFRRKIFDILGRFDEDFDHGEDCDFYFRAHEAGLPMHYEDDVGIYYRRHANNMTNDRPAVRKAYMQALKKSIDRRKAIPTLRSLDKAVLLQGVK